MPETLLPVAGCGGGGCGAGAAVRDASRAGAAVGGAGSTADAAPVLPPVLRARGCGRAVGVGVGRGVGVGVATTMTSTDCVTSGSGRGANEGGSCGKSRTTATAALGVADPAGEAARWAGDGATTRVRRAGSTLATGATGARPTATVAPRAVASARKRRAAAALRGTVRARGADAPAEPRGLGTREGSAGRVPRKAGFPGSGLQPHRSRPDRRDLLDRSGAPASVAAVSRRVARPRPAHPPPVRRCIVLSHTTGGGVGARVGRVSGQLPAGVVADARDAPRTIQDGA